MVIMICKKKKVNFKDPTNNKDAVNKEYGLYSLFEIRWYNTFDGYV